MHRVWLIQDLLIYILGSLEHPEVLRLGMTCRHLWKFAHPRLWTHLGTAKALCAILPDEDQIQIPSDASDSCTLSRPLTAVEWHRFKSSSMWTRTLSIPDTGADTSSEDNTNSDDSSMFTNSDTDDWGPTFRALTLLSTAGQDAYLFPRLEAIDVGLSSPPAARVCSVLLSHLTLIRVEITLWDSFGMWYEQGAPHLWNAMCSSSRTLQHLSISLHLGSLSQPGGLLLSGDLLHCMGSLTTLRLLGIEYNEELIRQVSRISRLQELQLEFSINNRGDLCHPSVACLGELPVLEHWIIRTTGMAVTPNFPRLLHRILSPHLRSVTLTWSQELPQMEETFSLLNQWSSTIEVLRVHVREQQNQAPVKKALTLLTLFPHLRYLDFYSDDLLEISDLEIAHIATAMPRWEVLRFYTSSIQRPFCTRQALIHIACSLNHLKRLTLDLNFDLPEELLTFPLPTHIRPSSRLTEFQTQSSLCTHPDNTAKFLYLLFPHLNSFGSYASQHQWPGKEQLAEALRITFEGY
ncbi:hypothetical protein DACRYDRAFT_104357 [Dacryopinax primogenitus]|uniref:F-box domain-containing protein n=1 Tax=Dacryopinax primogenitus (strain DJM 731) TaxID=1858805 RepID=M5GGP9_DACPD|nr:uncharacterized protein DACRYDRAFT_104357 [Dacryopinax primogenitus]EJU05868.1 hypothetical protein DACRYDRAFT_104357 [Dacryopinax primogenitus]